MSIAAIDIWFANVPSPFPDELRERCKSILSLDELELVNRFAFEDRRREALLTRALVRAVLAKYTGDSPQACQFKTNPNGRPFLKNAKGIDFNISHDTGRIVIAVSRDAQVGIDTEALSRADEVASIAPRVFTSEEIAAINALDGDARQQRLVQLWTLKEAWSKVRGDGVGADFHAIEFTFNADNEVTSNAGGGWRFECFDISNTHATALAVRTKASALALKSNDGLAFLAGL